MAEEHTDSVVEEDELPEVTQADIRALTESESIREALLYEPLDEGRVRCNICLRRCYIAAGRVGYCRTKINIKGKLYTTIYGVVSSVAADPIEKKPVYHYKPGSMCFSVGSLGCNFRCVFCQNWQIAFADAVDPSGLCESEVWPENLIKVAQDRHCQGIAWTYNEPSIWLNYALDCARLAQEASLYTCYVTNGYATPEGLDVIGPHLDIYRVDIKSMSDDFYRKLIKVPSVAPILEVAKRAKERWNTHLECVTNVIPGWNDDDENLRKIADWIVRDLGELTPWHVTRFFPYAKMMDVPPTPPETLLRARQVGLDVGLKFIYLGNIDTKEGQNTYCYNCGALAIERVGYSTKIVNLTPDGRCPLDGSDLNIRM